MVRFTCGMCVLGVLGCVERGRVEVVAFSDLGEGPMAGGLVVFADRDGASRTAHLDEDGHAAGDVEDGGSVWLVKWAAEAPGGSNAYVAYTGVHPGETLRFGPPEPPARAVRGTMAIESTALPPPASILRISSPCGKVLTDGRLELDERCGSTADVMAGAWERDRGGDRLISYAYLPARPIIDGGTIVIAAGDWRALDRVSIRLRNASIAGPVTLENPAFKSAAFERPTYVAVQGDTLSAAVPAIGSLHLSLFLRRDPGQPGQVVHVTLPAVTSQEIDLDQLTAPWVVRDGDPPRAWSADDLGGTLVAQAMVTQHRWNQPIANYEELVDVRLISAPALEGKIEVPRLPDALSSRQPGEDFQIDSTIHLIRIEGEDPSQAGWLAEQISRDESRPRLAELPVTSYASTSEP